MTTERNPREVNVYALGIVHASVCAPLDMPRDEVVAAVNAQEPTGLARGWTVHDEPFLTGEPNPHVPAGNCGRHWLMVC